MLTIVTTKRFEKSLQRMRKRGKSLVKIKSVIEQLATKGILESRYSRIYLKLYIPSGAQ